MYRMIVFLFFKQTRTIRSRSTSWEFAKGAPVTIPKRRAWPANGAILLAYARARVPRQFEKPRHCDLLLRLALAIHLAAVDC